MTTQHTPGPWSIDWNFIVAPDPSGEHADVYIAEIAESDEDGRIPSEDQIEANARLIAAAPDLLAALQHVLERATMPGFLRDEVKAAIARATVA
jgi:hypothetical protein